MKRWLRRWIMLRNVRGVLWDAGLVDWGDGVWLREDGTRVTLTRLAEPATSLLVEAEVSRGGRVLGLVYDSPERLEQLLAASGVSVRRSWW